LNRVDAQTMSPAQPPRALDWRSYDCVAENYDRFLGPNGYAALAGDLVTLLNPPAGGLVLDVGCGTGVAAFAARRAIGAGGLVVGVDPSLAMLRRASAGGLVTVAAGLPRLPFRDGVFDSVAASLVLSHVEPYDAGLRDMVRVLRAGGSLGVTAGARREGPANLAYQLWVETAESLVGRGALEEAGRSALPWEAWFTEGAHVATALEETGLEAVEIHRREYSVEMPANEYLSMFDVFAYGRFLRETLGERGWREFGRRIREVVSHRCDPQTRYVARYHVAVGRKPT
jgi:ubiquinone/menaquinone biosynthesis C-methylase UbiE